MTADSVSLEADYTIIYRDTISGMITGQASFRTQSRSWYDEWPTLIRGNPKPKGWLYPKAYERTVVQRTVPQGRIVREYNGETVTETGPFGGISVVPAPLAVVNYSQRDMALIQALSKLKDQRINLGVALAEAQQTADLIGSTAARFSRSINAFRRGRWKQGLGELGASARKAPQNWLELQYAWKPLMSDVHGAMEALAQPDKGSFPFCVKGILAETLEEDIETGLDSRYAALQHRKTFQGHFCRLDFVPSNTFLSSITSVGATNPLEIIWEKVPFSFVADWFSTVGASLSVLDATNGFRFISGSMTNRRETTVEISALGQGGMRSDGLSLTNDFRGRVRNFQLSRSVIEELPLIIKPHLKNPVSLGHLANGLSLMATVFSGSKLLNTPFRL